MVHAMPYSFSLYKAVETGLFFTYKESEIIKITMFLYYISELDIFRLNLKVLGLGQNFDFYSVFFI